MISLRRPFILKPRSTLLLLAAVLGLGLYLRTIGLTHPWGGHWDGWGGGYYSNIARNYLKYGFSSSRFLPILNAGEVVPGEYYYYTHHPPLLGFLLTASFWCFGIKEWAARLVPLSFSMLSMVLLFLAARRSGGPGFGLLSAFFYAVMPGALAYSTHLDPQGQLVIASTLLTLYGYLLHPDGTRPRLGLAFLLAGFLLGALSDWGAFYIFGFLFLHSYLVRRERRFRIALFCLLCAAAFFLYHLYVRLALEDAARPEKMGLLEAARVRMWGTEEDSLAGILPELIRNGYHFAGPPFLVLFIGWVVTAWTGYRRRPGTVPGLLPILLLLGVAAVHVILFPHGAAVHEWWFIYFAPPLAMAAGSLVSAWLRTFPSRILFAAALAGMAGLAVHGGWVISERRDAWNTDTFMKAGEAIRTRTPPRCYVFLTGGKAPPPLRFYADREIFPLERPMIPDLLSLLAKESRPAYLIIAVKDREALYRHFNAYMQMMVAGGIPTEVPIVDGLAVFLLERKSASDEGS